MDRELAIVFNVSFMLCSNSLSNYRTFFNFVEFNLRLRRKMVFSLNVIHNVFYILILDQTSLWMDTSPNRKLHKKSQSFVVLIFHFKSRVRVSKVKIVFASQFMYLFYFINLSLKHYFYQIEKAKLFIQN